MNKNKQSKTNNDDYFESMDKYLLDEYEEDFDYMHILDEGSRRRKSHFKDSEY